MIYYVYVLFECKRFWFILSGFILYEPFESWCTWEFSLFQFLFFGLRMRIFFFDLFGIGSLRMNVIRKKKKKKQKKKKKKKKTEKSIYV